MARIGTWEQNLTNGGCCRGATGPGLGSATVDLDQAAGWRKFSKVLSKHTLVGVRFRTVVCVSQLYHHFVKQRIVLKWTKSVKKCFACCFSVKRLVTALETVFADCFNSSKSKWRVKKMFCRRMTLITDSQKRRSDDVTAQQQQQTLHLNASTRDKKFHASLTFVFSRRISAVLRH